jgi:hypothetical protein
MMRVAAAAAVAGLISCARTAPTDESRPTSATPPAEVAPPPVDHLAPGELLEGTAHAFGLTLPRDLHVDATFADVIYASGEGTIHPMTKYFRARLEGGSLEENDSAATFDRVRILGAAGRDFHIHIGPSVRGVRVEIRDSTRPPAPDLPDEAARWRNVGLTPQGRVLEPTHLD